MQTVHQIDCMYKTGQNATGFLQLFHFPPVATLDQKLSAGAF